MDTSKTIDKLRETHSILLFDGLCNFCDNSVQFVIKRDPKRLFLYASLQSEAAKEFLKTQPESLRNIDSIILVTSDNVYTKSTAALKTSILLEGPWFLARIFLVFPTVFRDLVYDFIAKRRYRWFGKFDTCKIPTEDEKDMFLL